MTESLQDLEPGTNLDRYELLVPVAKGGMGRVWAARLRGSRGFRKLVAIKTILASSSEDQNFEQMLLDEALLASQIQHANVAQCLDFGEQDGLLYLVMEWVDGEPLDYLIKSAQRRSGFPLPAAVEVIAQACRGLHAAHEQADATGAPLGLVHRDVSPQNLMVTESGTVKLVDFGIAKATHRAPASSGGGEIKGKLSYMSPEQARGEAVDRRTDLFALGCVLYLLITGRHPFRGETPVETLRRICSNEPIVPPSTYRTDCPPELDNVVLRALARSAEERFATAKAMQEAAEAALRRSGENALRELVRSLGAERSAERRKAIREAFKQADKRTSSGAAGALVSGETGEFSSLRAITVTRRPSEISAAAAATGSADAHPAPPNRRGLLMLSAGALLLGAVGVLWGALRSPAPEHGSLAPAAQAAHVLPKAPELAPVPTPVASADARASAAPTPPGEGAPPPAAPNGNSQKKSRRAPKITQAAPNTQTTAVAEAPAPRAAPARDPLERRR